MMEPPNYEVFDATNMAMSRFYNNKQSKYLPKLPKSVGRKSDIFKLGTFVKDKRKEATNLYLKIKKDILLKLDDAVEKSTRDINKLTKELTEYLKQDQAKRDIQNTIEATKESREVVNDLLIVYDKLTWFKDPNLLSTIRFHQKLNEIFLARTEKVLEYDLNDEKIKETIKMMVAHPKYVKAIIVITFQPLLAYGALYASATNDYEYIIKYESTVSESAEEVFSYNPPLKIAYFQHTYA